MLIKENFFQFGLVPDQTQILKKMNIILIFFNRVPLICAVIFCYIIIECESKQFLVNSKSKKFWVKTKSGNSYQTKYRNLKGHKRGGFGQKKNYPTNDYNDFLTKPINLNSKGRKQRRSFWKRQNNPKNGFTNNQFKEFGNDYNDLQTKQRNLSRKGRDQRRSYRKRKNNPKDRFINDQYKEFGNDYKDWKTKLRNLNRKGRKHRKKIGKRKNYPKNGFNNNQYKEFGKDYNEWLSK